MPPAAIHALDTTLAWPLTDAEKAEEAEKAREAWGTGTEAQAGLDAALMGLGLTPDAVPGGEL
jgi:hypothetical protein